MRNPNSDAGNYTVSRIFMCSPHQNEVLRRNRSRIFVSIAGEGVIDSILFQGYRPIDQFIPAVERAIMEAKLKDPTSDELILRPAFDHNAAAGFNQQHLVSAGWLQNDEAEVYDLVIEMELQSEDLPDVNMKTFNGDTIEGFEYENPLCIAVDIQDLYPQMDDPSAVRDGSEFVEQSTSTSTETQTNADASAESNGGNGSGRGRVKDPENDRRLKANRENAMARRNQDRDDDSGSNMGRMAGKPGRVRDPRFDMRLKHNRGAAAQASGR